MLTSHKLGCCFYLKALTQRMPKRPFYLMDLKFILVKLLPHLTLSGELTHLDRLTQLCVINQTIIGSDNGLSPGWHQSIIWTNAGILLIEPLGTNFSEILIEIYAFSFEKMHLYMSSGEWRPFFSRPQLVNNPISVWHALWGSWSQLLLSLRQ